MATFDDECPKHRCSVVGCNNFGTEQRTPEGFAAPEHLCAEHAAAYDAAEDKSDFVASKMVY